MWLNLRFLETLLERFIIGLLALWISSFVMYMLKYFINIFGMSMFFLLIGKSSLYVVDKGLFSGICKRVLSSTVWAVVILS